MYKLLLIAIGGATGSLLRYLVGGWIQGDRIGFPLGTVIINITGCFAIGFLATLFTGPYMVREEYRVGILVGVLGGYTTFSSYAWESHNLAAGGQMGMALVNVLTSNILGLAAAWIGHRLCLWSFGV